LSERYRTEFPVFRQAQQAGQPLHYLDNPATTFRPQCVIDAVTEYYTTYPANVHRAMYALSERATDAFESARDAVQHFINASAREEIIFTSGTTHSINLLANAWCCRLGPDDTILTTAMDHHSNLIPWRLAAQRYGFTVRCVPVTPDGNLDLEAFDDLLDARVRLIALTHMSNVHGVVPPVETIIAKAHARGIPVCLDAAQSVAHFPIDVQRLGCDFLAFSGHKMFAPTGTGILYARRERLETMQPFMGGGDMINTVTFDSQTWADLPARFEAGTPNIAGFIGLHAAIHFIERIGFDTLAAENRHLTALLREALGGIRGLRILPGNAPDSAGLVSFTVEGIHPHDIAQFAAERGVAIRPGNLCAQPLLQQLGVPAVCRAGFALYNSEQDIHELVNAITDAERFFA
jgi:cysteine desulfurase/selenocysteine lyase